MRPLLALAAVAQFCTSICTSTRSKWVLGWVVMGLSSVGFIGQQALACEPVQLPLDATMSHPTRFNQYAIRDTALYMVKGLVHDGDNAVADRGDSWTVDCEHVDPALVNALAATVVDGTVDPSAVRQLFEANYLGTLHQRGQAALLKSTVLEFGAATNFQAWESFVVEFSAVKRKTRRIFRSPAGFQPMMSVAQTLDTETGDVSAAVLETEVAVQRLNGKDWDFYSYNRLGDLSNYSTFPAGERPAPTVCIMCHYNGGSRAVDRFLPEQP